jgi:hypothetical protein
MEEEVWWEVADAIEVIQLVSDREITANTMQHCMGYDKMIMNDVRV